MIGNTSLLKEKPLHVLAPYIELTPNVITMTDEDGEEESLFKYDGCGKALNSLYYLSIGIPPVLSS
jgi:hypothetical protein